jgi:hypothetical protein
MEHLRCGRYRAYNRLRQNKKCKRQQTSGTANAVQMLVVSEMRPMIAGRTAPPRIAMTWREEPR